MEKLDKRNTRIFLEQFKLANFQDVSSCYEVLRILTANHCTILQPIEFHNPPQFHQVEQDQSLRVLTH